MDPGAAAQREERCTASGTRADCASRSCGDLPVGRLVERGVESLLQKYFTSPVGQIISTNSRRPTPQEGRIMIVRNAGWNAVDAAAFGARWDRRADREICERSTARGREMLLRTAKSCGPDAPTLASSFAEFCRPNRAMTKRYPRSDGGKRARSPGRARHKP